MIARNCSANGQIPVKGTLKRFNKLKRFNYTIRLLDYIHLNPVKGALDSLEAYR